MLHVAEAFIEKSYHPTVICRGNLTTSTISPASFLFIIKLIMLFMDRQLLSH